MAQQKDEGDRLSTFAADLGQVISFTANEAILFKRLEKFFSPPLASLWSTEEEQNEIERRVTELTYIFGGPPALIAQRSEDQLPRYDMYLPAAFTEAVSSFWRARRSVARAHTFFIGTSMLKTNPELVNMSTTDKDYEPVIQMAYEAFWEHTETSFVRLASFWDRIGQVLDFVFFSIRQFERDGFAAVMDRIHVNHVPLRSDLKNSLDWRAIRCYQLNESRMGLKWLLRRRNLIVHSLNLRPLVDGSSERQLFDSEYNHLQVAARNKLAPGTPTEELDLIHNHLASTVRLFPHILTICENSGRKCR